MLDGISRPNSGPKNQPDLKNDKVIVPEGAGSTPTATTAHKTHEPDSLLADPDKDFPRPAPLESGSTKTNKPTKKRRSLIQWLKSRTKKQWIIIVIISVLVLAAIGFGAYWFFIHKKATPKAPVVQQSKQTQAPKPTTVPSLLSGLPVKPEVNDRPVTAVMIENSTDARPQSGLDQASVVFEAIAEGGITRFLTLFQDTAPDYIGPVRSVRPYYIQWANGFDAAIAHVGGSGEALQEMNDWNIKNLDQFAGANYFQRISSRYAPHNVYTSMSNLNAYEAKKGYGKPNFTGFARKDEKAAATPTARGINLTLSGFYFNVHYDYDAATNTYKRNEGNAAHMVVDAAGNKKQLAPKVVVALVIPYSLEGDGLHSQYNTIGSGHMYVFQDGLVTEGNWQKASRQQQFVFTNTDGSTLKLNPGQTWVTAVGANNQVSYTP